MSFPFRFPPSAVFTVATLAIAGAAPAPACSECGCSLSSDWAALSSTMTPGFDTGLRLEFYDQTDLRSGTGSIDRATITFPTGKEIQQRTLNRNVWLDLNFVKDAAWALAASIPYHDRFHTTIAEGDTDVSTSHAHGLGDIRLSGRYQKSGLNNRFALHFGLKLPTGRFDQIFSDGPQAGESLDRGLQLGTGTTDLLLGASWFARPGVNLGTFVQATLDQPLAERDGFLPSTTLNLSGGMRWLNSSRFTPQLQLNVKAESGEHGAEADTANSGGNFVHLSPGMTVELAKQVGAFVFVQLPVYQRVNGLQLEPKWLLSAGLRWGF